MTFQTKTVAQQLTTLAAALAGIGGAQIGVPESVDKRVYAMVTAGSQTLTEKATGTLKRDARFNITFAYRLEGSEATAEEALMDLIDLFLVALYADRTLGGRCRNIEVDLSLADAPEYQTRAGKEFREYPILVTAVQEGTFTINP
jgi:hypothetical protein